jgi:serine/threonine-protein kinase
VATDSNTIGQYQLVNCIASGNATQVWEVVDTETTRRMAMKLLLPERLKDAEAVASLKGEFKVASSFDHPNIPAYYQILVNRHNAYFVMDLFAAPNLKIQLFNDIRGVQIRLKRILELVSMALEHIHECGWIHRDIKPDNILVNKSAELRLIDFSLACRAAGSLSKMLHRKQTMVKGTRTYMAPEQILGKPLTPPTDIYNLGITLFELLTGEPPFKGSTPKDLLLRHLGEPAPAPSEFNPNVTPEMDILIQRMLSKKPEQRPKNMAELMAAFRNTRFFKEDVTEKVELTEKEKAEQELKATLGERLDSRTDALRTKFGVAAPPPRKKKKPTINPTSTSGPSSPGQGGRPPVPGMVPPMPMPPMPMPPMPMPAMPGMYPGQVPVAHYPGMMSPQGPVPWVMAPGPIPGGGAPPAGPWMQPPPPVPLQPLPGQQIPGQQMPGQPMPPQPMARPPMPVQPGAAQPGSASPPAIPRPPVVSTTQPPRSAPVPAPPPIVAPSPPVVRTTPPTPKPTVAPSQPAPPKPRPAAPQKPGEGFRIEDLAGFDDLPPES